MKAAIIILLLVISGCSTQLLDSKDVPESSAERFNVSFFNASFEGSYINEMNRSVDNISFIIKNNEDFGVECKLVLSIDNSSNLSSKKGVVGALQAGESKRVSLGIEMLSGTANLKFEPVCIRV